VYQQYRDTNRSVRLTQIQHSLHKYTEGLTTRDLAGVCNTSVRNIQRDLLVLQSDLHIPIEKRSYDRYVISREYILPPVAFSFYETLILFLALRLLVRQTDEGEPLYPECHHQTDIYDAQTPGGTAQPERGFHPAQSGQPDGVGGF
jgi:hypothetical protein